MDRVLFSGKMQPWTTPSKKNKHTYLYIKADENRNEISRRR